MIFITQPMECSLADSKDYVHHELSNLIYAAKTTDLANLAQVDRLVATEAELCGTFEVGTGHAKTLLLPLFPSFSPLFPPFTDHGLFLSNTAFQHKEVSWIAVGSTKGCTQIDHITINYNLRSSMKNNQSYWDKRTTLLPESKYAWH